MLGCEASALLLRWSRRDAMWVGARARQIRERDGALLVQREADVESRNASG